VATGDAVRFLQGVVSVVQLLVEVPGQLPLPEHPGVEALGLGHEVDSAPLALDERGVDPGALSDRPPS
jgi:hypothetical protein